LLKYTIKRIFIGIFVLIGLSILIFTISRIIPGDPARMALGPSASQSAVDELRREMYLDKSLPAQYYYWFTGVLEGNFGKSVNTKRPISQDIKDFFPATLELVLFSSILISVFSIIFGLIATGYHDRLVDSLLRFFSYIGISIPDFVIAIISILIFGYYWRVIPVLGRLAPKMVQPDRITGMLFIDSLIAGNFPAFFDAIKHLLLPSLALSLGSIFQIARLLRSSMVDNLRKEYISVAKGYGIPTGVILRKYLLKPSFIPIVSVLGLTIAELMGRGFIIESIFNWPGLARYGMTAMLTKDLNVISVVVLITGVAFIIANIVVDIIIGMLDPRIRLEE
jgi:peptide/nickel transport system permease protein